MPKRVFRAFKNGKMKQRNRVKEIIEEKFGLKPEPTQAQLLKMGMSAKRFGRIVNNSGTPMTKMEQFYFASWLGVEQSELIASAEEVAA